MVNISIRYTGDLHCAATHEPSDSELATDAPTDNLGKGEAFSPTDLLGTALGTCMLTTMAIVAERNQIDLKGATATVKKEMSDAPRRVGRLTSEVHIPLPANHPQREVIEKAGLGCPVHRSLASELERPTQFFWEG